MADFYEKTSSGIERIDVSVPKIEKRVIDLETKAIELDSYKVDVREQILTEEQKEQVRTNIGAVSPSDVPKGDFADYLPLDGTGIMTGSVKSSLGRNNPALHYGNSPVDGGAVWLFSKDDPNYRGGFIIRTHKPNGVEACQLQGNYDGGLYWNGITIPLIKNSVAVPGWVKFRGPIDRESWAFIWGSFSNVGNADGQTINLPIEIITMVYGSANPNGSSGANNHIFVQQLNTTQIKVSAGSGEGGWRSGQWFVLAHCNF